MSELREIFMFTKPMVLGCAGAYHRSIFYSRSINSTGYGRASESGELSILELPLSVGWILHVDQLAGTSCSIRSFQLFSAGVSTTR